VFQFDRSDCWKVTETVSYRSCTTTAVLVSFLVSCSLFHLYCLAIWLIIEHNLCCDLRLFCNFNFDPSGAWFTDLCPWFLLFTLRRFSTLKIYVFSFNVFLLLPLFVIVSHIFLQVREIIICCLLLWLSYYFYCIEFSIKLVVNIDDWCKFCDVFISGDYIFVPLFFWKPQIPKKKNQWCTKMKYKTKKNYLHHREGRIQSIFLSTLSHTLKWWNCFLLYVTTEEKSCYHMQLKERYGYEEWLKPTFHN